MTIIKGTAHFAMAKRRIEQRFFLTGFLMSLRDREVANVGDTTTSEKQTKISRRAGHVFAQWQQYSDPCFDQCLSEDGTPHHTVTPIARKGRAAFEMDLSFADNNVSKEHPDGIFIRIKKCSISKRKYRIDCRR